MANEPIFLIGLDENISAAIKDALKGEGYVFFQTNDVKDVQEVISEQRALFIFLSTTNTGNDGFDFLKKLKADPTTKRIPVILLSDHNDVINVEVAHRLGVNYVATKPYIIKNMVKRVAAETTRRKDLRRNIQSKRLC